MSAQGSVLIKRLRNGNNLFLTLDNTSKKPLYQAVDPDNGNAIAPDWTVAANRPVIKPTVTSARANTDISVTNPKWYYNGVLLTFNTSGTSGFTTNTNTDASVKGKFQFNPTDNSIKPIKNLADPNALANGLLAFECVVKSGGGEYAMSKSVDVILVRGGASSYYGAITATNLTLDDENPTSKLYASLYCGGTEVSDFHVTWKKDNDAGSLKSGMKSALGAELEVTREGVNGQQLYVAEFRLKDGDSPVAIAGVTIVDSADVYIVVCDVTSAVKHISDDNASVTVKARLLNARTGQEVTSNVYWRLDVVNPQTYASLQSFDNMNPITVTKTHTDRTDSSGNSVVSDVMVLADATWVYGFSATPQAQNLQTIASREITSKGLYI